MTDRQTHAVNIGKNRTHLIHSMQPKDLYLILLVLKYFEQVCIIEHLVAAAELRTASGEGFEND